MINFTYQIGQSIYVNITNRCTSNCVFCNRKGDAVIKGYNLKMSKAQEPTAVVYINEIGDPKRYNEVVLCGYGEPTIRWEVVKKVAKYVKGNGGKTRLNTNGHGNLINKRDITTEMTSLIDTVSISLNSTNPKQYSKLMRIKESFFYEMIDFAQKVKNYTKVIMTIVSINSVDRKNAKVFSNKVLGVNFRERIYL